jgi:hypothetical protein
MENYKQASKLRVRFQTTKGTLTVEQLWDLSLPELDLLAVSLEKDYKQSAKKSFLVAKSKKDKELKLKFDVALDILTTKVEENEAAQKEADTKAHNQKILGLIKDKQDDELKGKSIKELEKMLK